MFIIVKEPDKERLGMPYTTFEQNLILLHKVTGGCYSEPKSAEEMESDFWFFERGKGFFLGDKGIFKDRYVEAGEIGVDGGTIGFQPIRTGSSPVSRSKK